MRVLVCGSREWTDERIVVWVLDGINENEGVFGDGVVVIEGGARGADACAAKWCDGFGGEYPQPHEQYPADWDRYGNPRAAHIRNQQMIDEGKPDVVVAFVDNLAESNGTRNMVVRAKKAGIPTYIVSHA